MTRMNQWIAILIVCSLTLGCTTQFVVDKENRRIITPTDFVGNGVPSPSPRDDLFTEETVTDEVAKIALEEIEFVTEESVLVPTRISAAVIVESLVGQVNGRPVFANEIIEPIADQLLVLSEDKKLDITAFKNSAKQQIANQMRSVVTSELLLSEAKSGMTVEEKRGLFSYLQRVREDMASSAGGSQSAVTRLLLDEEGQTVDEFLDFKQQQLLIDQLLREKVTPHIQVTWRDVMREWEKNKHQFNVPGKVTLGMIRVSSEEEVEIVHDLFSRGDPFATVATNAGMKDGGVWDTFELGEDGLSGIEVADSIKAHIVSLNENEIVGPINIASSSYWFTIIKIQEAKTASIWEPQIQLRFREYLFSIRRMVEENRFLERILADGSYDEFNKMVDRTLHVAVTRYMH